MRGRVVVWALASWAVLVGAGGLVTLLVTGSAVMLWLEPAWWAASLVYLVVLLGPVVRMRAEVAHSVLAALVAAVLYVAAGSLLSSFGSLGPASPALPGSEWGPTLAWISLVPSWSWGKGVVAIAAPLLLALLPWFRPALLGAHPVWSQRGQRAAAAEDARAV
jgi:hypothetical protein